MIRVLLVGPLPPPMGGDTRHFATLADDLSSNRRFSVRLVNTSRGTAHSDLGRNIVVSVQTIVAVITNLRNVDIVSYHASDRGIFLFGPIIVGVCRLVGMPIVLRIFGGSFGDYFQSKSAVGRMLIRRLVLSSDVILLQTKRSIGQLRAQSAGRLEWFSTYVKSATAPAPARVARHHDCDATCRRFVFLGHLWRTKGLETMLEAAPHLPNDVSIDIYGPTDEYTPDEIHARGLGRVRYCGFLSHEQVEAKLWEYDCLVLPTYHPGEGYPGVIAEGFAHSLPVVTTRWLAIPEIVDASCGILVEPGDTEEFVGALLALNRDRAYWLALKDGARKKAVQFDHARWSRRFEEICEELVGS